MSPSTYKTVEDISMIAHTNIASHQMRHQCAHLPDQGH